jgi:hypothetical protein
VWRLDCQGKNIIGRYWGKNKHSWHRRVLDVFWKEKGERAGGLVIGYVVGEVTRDSMTLVSKSIVRISTSITSGMFPRQKEVAWSDLHF